MSITPHSVARRVACPGSRALEEKYPVIEKSPSATEGELAHSVAMQICTGKLLPKSFDITPEMERGAELFFDTLGSDLFSTYLEQEIKIPLMDETITGRPDAWFYNTDTKTLYIYDYKFGRTPVEAFENWQMIEYAYGILCSPRLILIEKFIFKIIQPRDLRGNTIKTWEISANDIA